ncbi:MAG: diguanylate cyclase [Gammaproteobacteria bacterium]|nr:MAG: diguanylate cyclase [Gammaproteobacteria bacterium]
MRKLFPAMCVSLGLIMAVISVILLSDLLGLMPDRATAVIDGRKKLAETLAIQYSLAARRQDYDSIEYSMRMQVERNGELLSAALRNAAGEFVMVIGEHAEYWNENLGEKSTPTHMHVPIYTNAIKKQKWGAVELRFADINKISAFGVFFSPLALMVGFVAVTGFLVFLILIKKIFTNIDPSAVVPTRVRKALDTLTEGVLLVDKKGKIMFANEVFADTTGMTESQIIGKKVEDLNWKETHGELPWEKAMKSGVSIVGEKIELAVPGRVNIQFVVNSSPVLDDKGKQQGVMITFDDVTELEEKNNELRDMVYKLKESSDQINRQNEELRVLATRDPLTNCLNRRSLFDQFEEKCLEAIKNNVEFSCMMLDIDHFKNVNDTYGHAAGDEVLRVISAATKAVLRSNDEVFRYGGEEFCVLLPGADVKSAYNLAERVRKNIEAQVVEGAVEDQDIRVTASIGLSSIRFGSENLPALIESADAALYESKRTGRNKATIWQPEDIQTAKVEDIQKDKSAEEPGTTVLAGEHIDVDKITGLPNRAHFRRELARTIEYARQHDEYATVLMLDLDMFKRINNVFGYSVGDTVLDTVAKRLSGTLRASDSTCRLGDDVPGQGVFGLGGDEFGILLTGLESKENVHIVVERLVNSLASPVTVDDEEIYMTCCVGVSQFPADGSDADTLVTCAGAALQQAKRDDMDSVQYFHDDFVSVARSGYEIENSLRYALENDEFELYFQPQLAVQSLRIESMEALIRWHHPQHGIVPPSEFIPAAEASGQIIDIGKWVIKTACQQVRSWLDVGLELPVAINLSPVQFRQKDLVEQINAAVSSAMVDPQYLQLEITESMVMEDVDRSLEIMQTLSRFGYRISIDDFGTGYSSLEYLKRFPVDFLKIDRAFIKDIDTDPGDAAIVSAAINMAHSMGLQVVAEGVETEEQLLFLRNLHCDMIQGFLLGVPLPAKDAIALIDEKQWKAQA